MPDKSQRILHLVSDLNSLLDRYSLEYDLSVCEVVGCLEMVKLSVVEEQNALHDNLPDDEDNDPLLPFPNDDE